MSFGVGEPNRELAHLSQALLSTSPHFNLSLSSSSFWFLSQSFFIYFPQHSTLHFWSSWVLMTLHFPVVFLFSVNLIISIEQHHSDAVFLQLSLVETEELAAVILDTLWIHFIWPICFLSWKPNYVKSRSNLLTFMPNYSLFFFCVFLL